MGKKGKIILCDSNILFEFFKGNRDVKNNLTEIGDTQIAFSIITHAEAYAGSSKDDVRELKLFFGRYPLYHIDENTSKIFNGLMLSYYNRHSKWIPDALIAATALSNQIELYTLNRKDFDFIPYLTLYNP